MQLVHPVTAGPLWVFSLKQKPGLQSVVVVAENCFILVAGSRFLKRQDCGTLTPTEYAANATRNLAHTA